MAMHSTWHTAGMMVATWDPTPFECTRRTRASSSWIPSTLAATVRRPFQSHRGIDVVVAMVRRLRNLFLPAAMVGWCEVAYFVGEQNQPYGTIS